MATTVQGAAHPLAKLTDPDVRRMREAHAAGETISALSREFNVSRTQVRKIVEGRAWRHVGEKPDAVEPVRFDPAAVRVPGQLNAYDVFCIRHATSAPVATLAIEYGVTEDRIREVWAGAGPDVP